MLKPAERTIHVQGEKVKWGIMGRLRGGGETSPPGRPPRLRPGGTVGLPCGLPSSEFNADTIGRRSSRMRWLMFATA
eukprot:355524-Chlamydomonas_euryale.AAC.53